MTTVDRRAVQELIEQAAAERYVFPETAIGHIRIGLRKLPSSNAQAVAWQCRIPGHKFYGEWNACTKEAFDDPGDKWEVRALCVCSGDAKEADK